MKSETALSEVTGVRAFSQQIMVAAAPPAVTAHSSAEITALLHMQSAAHADRLDEHFP
jgi:hypothetical protein